MPDDTPRQCEDCRVTLLVGEVNLCFPCETRRMRETRQEQGDAHGGI